MIIFKNKNLLSCSLYPNEDWIKDGSVKFIVEDNTELAKKILQYAPYFEEILDNDGKLIDIIPMERPEPIIEEPEPTIEDYLLDLEYRTSILELGGLQR